MSLRVELSYIPLRSASGTILLQLRGVKNLRRLFNSPRLPATSKYLKGLLLIQAIKVFDIAKKKFFKVKIFLSVMDFPLVPKLLFGNALAYETPFHILIKHHYLYHVKSEIFKGEEIMKSRYKITDESCCIME